MSADQERLRLAVAGDADALSDLLSTHGPMVARRLSIDRQWQGLVEADDVMQVTYLEAFLQIGRFDLGHHDSFEAWLGQIARHNLLDAIRGLSRKRQPQPDRRVRPEEDSSLGLLELLGVDSATPSREVGRLEHAELLDEAIRTLPPDYSKVVRLYDLNGMHADEVASAMGRSPGAVHMLRARAHDALRERLGGESRFFSKP